MKNEYKKIFDNIEPSKELEDSVLNYKNKRISIAPKKVIALVAVIAIVITGGSLGAYQLAVKPAIPQSIIDTTGDKSLLDFSIVAYATEGEAFVKPLSDKLYTDINYQIIKYDTRGKSENDIEKLWQEFEKKYNVNDKEDFNSFKCQLQRLDNALVGRAVFDAFDINVENPELVEKINVRNESKYGEIVIQANDEKFDNDGNIIQSADMTIEELQNFHQNGFIKGTDVSISGERFEKCKRLEKECGSLFSINWEMNDNLWQAINRNPDMDLSAITDVVTVSVEYKDGTVAQSKINISFNSDGTMQVKLDK